MLYKILTSLCISSALAHSCFLDAQRGKAHVDTTHLMAAEDMVYKKVYDHYSDILECFYAYEKADYKEKDFYCKEMLNTIKRCVQGDTLPLYGNFFNRMWRNTTACSDSHFPMKKIDTLLIEDALGHLQKQYNQKETPQAVDLIRSLNHIRQLVRQSVDYRCEELELKIRALESKVSLLKSEVKTAHSESEKLRSKLSIYEPHH